MIRKLITATSMSAALVLAAALAIANAPADAADPVETGRFVWHDLMTKDVSAAKRFYGELLGWRFNDTKRGDRPYVLARSGKRSSPVLSISPRTRMPARSGSATCLWLT
jgi:Bleomycin resistance protein-like N-terminal